jgi:Cdc6-like AAA superfamily ATPase
MFGRKNLQNQLSKQGEFLNSANESLMYVEGRPGVGKTFQTFLSIMQYLNRYPAGKKKVLWIKPILGCYYQIHLMGIDNMPGFNKSH